MFKSGYSKLKKEIEIQTILKRLRVVTAATKTTFTERDWKKFKVQNSLRPLQLTGVQKFSLFKDDPDKSKDNEEKKSTNPLLGGMFSAFIKPDRPGAGQTAAKPPNNLGQMLTKLKQDKESNQKN